MHIQSSPGLRGQKVSALYTMNTRDKLALEGGYLHRQRESTSSRYDRCLLRWILHATRNTSTGKRYFDFRRRHAGHRTTDAARHTSSDCFRSASKLCKRPVPVSSVGGRPGRYGSIKSAMFRSAEPLARLKLFVENIGMLPYCQSQSPGAGRNVRNGSMD